MDKIKEMLGICMEDDDAKTVAPTITSQRDAQPTHEHTAPLHHQEEHEEQKSKLPSALESRKKEEGKLPSTDSSNRESEESKEKIQLLYKKLAHRNAGLGGVDVVPEQRHGLFAWAGYLYITYYYS